MNSCQWNLIARAVTDVHRLLFGDGEIDVEPSNALWDDDEEIPAGYNHEADWTVWDQQP